MLSWIRWWGLGVFVAVMGGLIAFFMLVASPLIQSGIEELGSRAAGAEVAVEGVSLSLAPLGVELTGLTVANADKPMENIIEFDRAVADLEFGPLFLGKSIIRDLSIDTLQFNTPRTTSGALHNEEHGSDSGTGSEGASASEESTPVLDQLPSAEELLAREQLKTEAAGRAFQETWKTRKDEVDTTLDKVPSKEDLKQYEQDIKALLNGDLTSLEDFQQRKAKLDELRKRFKEDKKAVEEAQHVIGATRIEVGERLRDLRDAPAQDMANLKQKYQLNGQGAANLSQLLFGSEVGEWAHKALYWYEKIKPWLGSGEDGEPEEVEPERATGRYVHFPTSNPWPDFLVRSTGISAMTSEGNLAITGQDLTHQQAILGRPSHIDVDGEALHRVKALNARLTLDHRRSPGRDTVTLDVVDWQVESADLGVGGTQLDSAMAQLQGMAQVEGDQLVSKLDTQFGQATFTGTGQTLFAKELLTALSTIDHFTVDAKATGELTSPSVEMGSDLDARLSAAFSQRLRQQQDKLEARLQSRLDDKIDEFAGPYASELKALNNMDASLTERFDQLETLASAKLEDFATQQKRKAQEKADAKLAAEKQEAKEKLDAEKRKAEEEAKDKLKDKLKSLF